MSSILRGAQQFYVFICMHHRIFGFWILLLNFWRTTATVVKKFPMNRIRKLRPHIKTWHHMEHREQYMSKHNRFHSISCSSYGWGGDEVFSSNVLLSKMWMQIHEADFTEKLQQKNLKIDTKTYYNVTL